MVPMIVMLILAIIFIALLMLSSDFKSYVIRKLRTISAYLPVVFGIAIALMLLIILGAFIPWPIFKAITFLFLVAMTLGIWFPFGLLLRIFRINSAVFPVWIKAFVAWICFIAFLGIIFPSLMSKPIVIFGALILWGFFSGLSSKFDVLNRVTPYIVIILLIWVSWKYVAPNSFRATARFFQARSELLYTKADRNSIETEANAKATYGHLLKDVNVAYKVTLNDEKISTITDMPIFLKRNSVFLVVNHQKENYAYDGQSFLEIKLPNSNGSYVTGTKIWIDADLIEVGDRAEIESDLQSAGNSIKKQEPEERTSQMLVSPEPIIINGTKVFNLKAGEFTPWFASPDGVYSDMYISSPSLDFRSYVSDGTDYPGGFAYPVKKHCYWRVKAFSDQFVTVVVVARK